MIGDNARAIDLPAQRYNARVISHSFTRGLPGAIGDRVPHEIIESAPFGERKWKAPNNALKNVIGSLTGQFARLR